MSASDDTAEMSAIEDILLERIRALESERRDAMLFLGVLIERLGGEVDVSFEDVERVRRMTLVRDAPRDFSRTIRFRCVDRTARISPR